jgi:hypothetical protein
LTAAALAFTFLVALNGSATAADAASFVGYVRDDRLQFRPIFQLHPSLPKETFFYFVDPPFLSWNLNGLVTLRYGANVTASGLDYETKAGLRDHQVAYAVYRDDQNTLREEWVDPGATVRADPATPARYAHSITLDGYELVNNRVEPGGSIILLLYWSIGAKVDKNYTVFAHLVNSNGAMVAGHDSQPKRSTAPTSTWPVNGRDIVDAVVVPIDDGVSPGDNYRLQIGLYDESTMQRLPVVDANGQPFDDKVEFAQFSVVAKGTVASP